VAKRVDEPEEVVRDIHSYIKHKSPEEFRKRYVDILNRLIAALQEEVERATENDMSTPGLSEDFLPEQNRPLRFYIWILNSVAWARNRRCLACGKALPRAQTNRKYCSAECGNRYRQRNKVFADELKGFLQLMGKQLRDNARLTVPDESAQSAVPGAAEIQIQPVLDVPKK
jgi:predicted nucleic acid-binding Zn ribbon protein